MIWLQGLNDEALFTLLLIVLALCGTAVLMTALLTGALHG